MQENDYALKHELCYSTPITYRASYFLFVYCAVIRYYVHDERGVQMSKSITDKNKQVSYLKERLQIFVEVLDAIDPETADIEDIDRLIQMLDDVEDKMDQFKSRPESAE